MMMMMMMIYSQAEWLWNPDSSPLRRSVRTDGPVLCCFGHPRFPGGLPHREQGRSGPCPDSGQRGLFRASQLHPNVHCKSQLLFFKTNFLGKRNISCTTQISTCNSFYECYQACYSKAGWHARFNLLHKVKSQRNIFMTLWNKHYIAICTNVPRNYTNDANLNPQVQSKAKCKCTCKSHVFILA